MGCTLGKWLVEWLVEWLVGWLVGWTVALGFVFLGGCNSLEKVRPVEGEKPAAEEPVIEEPALENIAASGVRMDIALGNLRITAKGDRLEMDRQGNQMILRDNGVVEYQGTPSFRITADEIAIAKEGQAIECTGHVRAKMDATIPKMWGEPDVQE